MKKQKGLFSLDTKMEQRNFYQKSLTYEWKKLEDIRVLVPIVLKIVETIQLALTNTEPEPVEEP